MAPRTFGVSGNLPLVGWGASYRANTDSTIPYYELVDMDVWGNPIYPFEFRPQGISGQGLVLLMNVSFSGGTKAMTRRSWVFVQAMVEVSSVLSHCRPVGSKAGPPVNGGLAIRNPNENDGYNWGIISSQGTWGDTYLPTLTIEYTPIPEPTTICLILSGAMLLWRKKK